MTLLIMSVGSEWKPSVFQVQIRPRMGYTKFLILPLLKSMDFGLLVIVTLFQKNCRLSVVMTILMVWVGQKGKTSIFSSSKKS